MQETHPSATGDSCSPQLQTRKNESRINDQRYRRTSPGNQRLRRRIPAESAGHRPPQDTKAGNVPSPRDTPPTPLPSHRRSRTAKPEKNDNGPRTSSQRTFMTGPITSDDAVIGRPRVTGTNAAGPTELLMSSVRRGMEAIMPRSSPTHLRCCGVGPCIAFCGSNLQTHKTHMNS